MPPLGARTEGGAAVLPAGQDIDMLRDGDAGVVLVLECGGVFAMWVEKFGHDRLGPVQPP